MLHILLQLQENLCYTLQVDQCSSAAEHLKTGYFVQSRCLPLLDKTVKLSETMSRTHDDGKNTSFTVLVILVISSLGAL